jgi:phosphonate transport system substrate-binding protein
MFAYHRRFIFSIAIMILPGTFAQAQNSRQATQSLVIATYQYADNPRIKNIEPFAQYFTSITGIKTEVKSYPNVKALLLAMEQEEADVAFMNTFGYLMLREKSAAYEAGAVLGIPAHGENAYKSVMVVGRNVPENTLEDVVTSASDFTLVLVSEGSTSGNLVPRLKLASMQPGYPERFFLEVQYTNNHKLTMERALKGEFALCAFGSDEYYKLGADTVRLKKVWESPVIPLGPVVYRKALPESVRGELQKSLLQLHQQYPEALESIKAGWTEAIQADRYNEVKDDYYESLLQLSHNREVALLIIRNFAR